MNIKQKKIESIQQFYNNPVKNDIIRKTSIIIDLSQQKNTFYDNNDISNNNKSYLVPLKKTFCETIREKFCCCPNRKKYYFDAVIKIPGKNIIVSHQNAFLILCTLRDIARHSQPFLRTLSLMVADSKNPLPKNAFLGYQEELLRSVNIDISSWLDENGCLMPAPEFIIKIAIQWKDSHAFVMSTRKMNEELYQQELFYRRIEK